MASRKSKSPLLFILLTVFIDFLGIGLLQPVLPFLVERFRSDAVTLGWLASTYAIAQFLAAPVLGAISDRVGRRPVLLISMLGSAVGYWLFGLAPTLAVMFAARLIEGITGGVVSTAQAYIADVSTPEERTKNFGLVGMAFGLGFIFGPTLGGALVQFGLNMPVYAAGTLAFFNAIFGYLQLPESLPQRSTQPFRAGDLNPFRQMRVLAADRRIRRLIFGFFLFNLGFNGFTSIFAYFTKNRFNWGPGQTATLFVVIGLALTFVQGYLIRKLVPRLGEARLILIGLPVACLAFFVVTIVPSATWLYASQTLLAFGVGVSTPALRGLISNAITAQEQGRVIGGTQAVISLAQILGPIWASYCFDHMGEYSPFWVGIVLFVIALAVIAPRLSLQRAPSPPLPEATSVR